MKEPTTMPKTTVPTRDELEAQAAALNAQLEAIREQERKAAADAENRREAAREKFDREQVAAFDRRALNEECDQAEATLLAALTADPLVVALTEYTTTLRRRRLAVYDDHSLRQRLDPAGTSPLVDPPRADVPDLLDLLAGLIERTVQHRIEDERAEVVNAREAAAEAAAQQG